MNLIGKRVEIVGKHLFKGERGQIVRTSKTSWGNGFVIKLDKNGVECFVYNLQILKIL